MTSAPTLNYALSLWVLTVFGCWFGIQAFVNFWQSRQDRLVLFRLRGVARRACWNVDAKDILSAFESAGLCVEPDFANTASMSYIRSLLTGWLSASLLCMVQGVAIECAYGLSTDQRTNASWLFYSLSIVLTVLSIALAMYICAKCDGGMSIAELLRPKVDEETELNATSSTSEDVQAYDK